MPVTPGTQQSLAKRLSSKGGGNSSSRSGSRGHNSGRSKRRQGRK